MSTTKQTILRKIEDINKRIQSITYRKEKPSNYFNFQIVLDKDKYEFRFDANPNCCERFGYNTYLGNDDKKDDITDNKDLLGENISKIQFVYVRDYDYEKSKILIRFIKDSTEFPNAEEQQEDDDNDDDNDDDDGQQDNEDNILFTIEFYNNHNGYYPHRLMVNLYENSDSQPMNIFTTRI